MSNPGTPKLNIPSIPGLKNYPVIDTLVRNLIGYGCAIATAMMVGYLNSKGFDTKWVVAYLPEMLATAGVAVATFAWGAVVKHKTMIEMVEKTMEAAQTGQVPAEVKAAAPTKSLAKIEQAGL